MSLIFQWNSTGITVESYCFVSGIPTGIPQTFYWNFQKNFTRIPVEFHWYDIPLEYHSNFSDISLEFRWFSTIIPVAFHCEKQWYSTRYSSVIPLVVFFHQGCAILTSADFLYINEISICLELGNKPTFDCVIA